MPSTGPCATPHEWSLKYLHIFGATSRPHKWSLKYLRIFGATSRPRTVSTPGSLGKVPSHPPPPLGDRRCPGPFRPGLDDREPAAGACATHNRIISTHLTSPDLTHEPSPTRLHTFRETSRRKRSLPLSPSRVPRRPRRHLGDRLRPKPLEPVCD